MTDEKKVTGGNEVGKALNDVVHHITIRAVLTGAEDRSFDDKDGKKIPMFRCSLADGKGLNLVDVPVSASVEILKFPIFTKYDFLCTVGQEVNKNGRCLKFDIRVVGLVKVS